MPIKVEFPANPNRRERRKALADLRRSGRRIERALERLQRKGRNVVAMGQEPEEGPKLDVGEPLEPALD